MDKELQLTFGKLLGEMYRIQKEQGIARVDDGRIFGLLNGVEEAISSELNGTPFISNEQIEIVSDYLSPYWSQEKSLDELSDLSMRMDLERKGINEGDLYIILKYLKSTGRFEVEIDKLGSYQINKYDI